MDSLDDYDQEYVEVMGKYEEDKGLSALNYPHKIHASAVWEPTLGNERRWVRAAANGWTVAPLFVESSGRPYSSSATSSRCTNCSATPRVYPCGS